MSAQTFFEKWNENTGRNLVINVTADCFRFSINLIFRQILRCFDTVFRKPYRYYSIASKVILSLSDRYEIFTID